MNSKIGLSVKSLITLTCLKAGLYDRPNQINDMNDSRGGRCFENPSSKIGTRTRTNFNFGTDVHNYLKNQEMSCILIYFNFLCQLKGHKATNKLVM